MDKNILLTFRGKHVLKLANDPGNVNKISQRALLTYRSVSRLIKKPGEVQEINLSNFGRLMIYGLGFGIDQLREMRLGDVFEIEEVCDDQVG